MKKKTPKKKKANGTKPLVIGELPPVQELAMMLHATCREHISIEGFRFFGTSWAQISGVLEKYGYETELPF